MSGQVSPQFPDLPCQPPRAVYLFLLNPSSAARPGWRINMARSISRRDSRTSTHLLRKTGLPFTEPQGAYYVMLDISSLGFATDTEASEWLIRDIGVAGVAGSNFFREPVNHLIRFHFAKNAATLQAAGERPLRLC